MKKDEWEFKRTKQNLSILKESLNSNLLSSFALKLRLYLETIILSTIILIFTVEQLVATWLFVLLKNNDENKHNKHEEQLKEFNF